MVHESDGPVTGSVSQNWTCWKSPPGLLMQQVFVEEPEQDRSAVVLGQDSGVPARVKRTRAASAAMESAVEESIVKV